MYPYQRSDWILLINFYSIPKQAIVIIIPHLWLSCFGHWISRQDGQRDLRAEKKLRNTQMGRMFMRLQTQTHTLGLRFIFRRLVGCHLNRPKVSLTYLTFM